MVGFTLLSPTTTQIEETNVRMNCASSVSPVSALANVNQSFAKPRVTRKPKRQERSATSTDRIFAFVFYDIVSNKLL